MEIVCKNCKKLKKHNARGLCKKCYDTSPHYKRVRNTRRLGCREVVSQVGRVKKHKRVNEILHKLRRTGGKRDKIEVVRADIQTLKREITKLKEINNG